MAPWKAAFLGIIGRKVADQTLSSRALPRLYSQTIATPVDATSVADSHVKSPSLPGEYDVQDWTSVFR